MLSASQEVAQILLLDNKIKDEQYQSLQTEARQSNLSIDEVLLKSGFVAKEDFMMAKARMMNVGYVDLVSKDISKEVVEILSEKTAKNYKMAVFEHDKGQSTIRVAMLNPLDSQAREALRYIAREKNFQKVEYFLTNEEGIEHVLKKYANIREEVGAALESAKEQFEAIGDSAKLEKKEEDIQEVIRHAPVAKMMQVILRHAVEGNASDIHIEPLDNFTRVRYRIDGDLRTSLTLPLYIHDALVARVKVMSNLKIDETRIPQDGRIRIEFNEKNVELRVSTLPLREHEKVVLRILNTGGSAPTLADLGYRARNLDIINRNITKPNGMLLVTGPTGSGKSMTLFSALSILNSEDVNISTLEDPVEYQLQGINQSQIRPNVGFSFATGLRALLRQDPNIIMVGEIRDFETAELAIHAAMTGHLVLSTLHTNGAIDSIPRLLDMKVEPYLISTTLNVLVAQRLVRINCTECKEVVEIDRGLQAQVLKEVGVLPKELLSQYGVALDRPTFYLGKGCARCGGSGFKGRTSINEVIENTKSLRRATNTGMKPEDIEFALKEQGFFSMKQDGILKALLGITTLEQVLAVTKEEG